MNNYVLKKYMEFYKKHQYIPQYFDAYNCKEVKDYNISLATTCGTPGHIGCTLIIEDIDE